MTVGQWRADSAHIATLAGPLILTQFAQVALSTTDIVMMGLLGPLDVAAGGLALALFNLLRTMGVGLMTPTGNLVAAAKANPSHAEREIRDMVRAGFAIATLAGLVFWAMMMGAGRALIWFGQDSAVVSRTTDYLVAAAPGILPLLWFQALRNFTVGLRRPGPLLAIAVVSIGVNVGLNYALMFGIFGLPALGLVGIALSTMLVNVLSFFAFLLIVRRDPTLASYLSVRFWRTGRHAFMRTLRLGLPVAATYGSEAGFFTVITLMIGAISAEALAAHTVINQLVYIAFMISVGLSHASSISISAVWAKAQFALAKRFGYTGLSMGLVCMAFIGLAYVMAPQTLLQLFLRGNDNPAVLTTAVQLLMIAAVLQFFDCTQNIGIGLLRGAGETASTFAMTVIGYWGIGLPAAWILGVVLQLGAAGIWLGLAIGVLATAVQVILRFRKVVARCVMQDSADKMAFAK